MLCSPIGVLSSAVRLKIFAIAAVIKRYKSIIKKSKNEVVKIVLIAYSKSNSIEVLISMAAIELNISHYEFVLINYVLKRCGDIEEEIKNLNT